MEPLKGTELGRTNGIEKVNYSHDAMIDVILAQPGVSQVQLAAMFGYTQGWVSRVIGSDAFQARLAERKVEIVNPEIKATFDDRLKGLANQSLDIIQRKLDATQSADLAVKALDLSTKALGYGARPQNATQINNFVVALPEKATSEQDWASQAKANVQSLARPAPAQVIDVEVKVPDAPSAI
jgi:hypothetical protein